MVYSSLCKPQALQPTNPLRLEVMAPTPQTLYQAPATIHRLMLSPDGQKMALELREEESMECGVVVVDSQSGQELVEAITTPEGWWSELAGLSEDYLFLHSLHADQLPSTKALFAYRIADGQALWSADNLRFSACSGQTLKAEAVSQEGGQTCYFSASTGQALYQTELPPLPQPGRFPDTFAKEHPDFALMRQFIEDKTGHPTPENGTLAYLETEKHFVLGYYTKIENIEFQLLIADLEGNPREQHTVASDLKGIVQDLFFMVGNRLVCIQHFDTLICYDDL